ncbi:MAG: ParB/RepB/Spo0J family partition protein [Acholeplasmataceae bacterium]|nr:ParB/RepB/Spo0J family partition protein [Acholeplasmataceae bacterium]
MNQDKKPRKFVDLLKEHHVDDVLEGEVIEEVLLNEIRPNPFQPRRMFDQEKIDELAQSIKEYGIFQPIIIKKMSSGYIIVSGERRFRAANQIGLKTIPSIVRQYEEAKVAEIALAENLQRENLTPIEEAEAYRNMMKHLDITQNDLAKKIGKSRSHVTNMLGLLNLPDETQMYLLKQQISMGHARALSKLKDAELINKLAQTVIKKQLSVRQVEDLTKLEKKTNQIKRKPQIKYLEEEKQLMSYLNRKVKVDEKKITIYYDEHELNYIINRIIRK